MVCREPLVLELQPRLHALAFGKRQEAHDDMRTRSCGPALRAARRSAPRSTRSKAMLLSRSASMALSSAAAERGISQRPKARKAARSSGAPLSAGSVPISSGFLSVVVPDDDALVAQIEQRLGALDRGVEIGDAAAQLDILGCGPGTLADQADRREKCRAHDAGEHRELHDLDGAEGEERTRLAFPAHAPGRRRAPPKPRKSRAGSCAGIARVRRRERGIQLPPARAAVPESLSPAGSACPA